MLSSEERAGALRAAGLRVTAPRLAVLRALQDMPHADTDTVTRSVSSELGAVSAQAIYNILGALVVSGLVRRIEPAGSPALYELRVGDNHHHAVCRRCGATTDIDCAVRRRPCLTPSETHGYLLDEAEVTFWGLCPACQESLETALGPVAPLGPAAPLDPLGAATFIPTATTNNHGGTP